MELFSERALTGYRQVHGGIIRLVDSVWTEAVHGANTLTIATYQEIG